MNFLRDLHVLVLGLGDSGLAMARWCVRCGAASVTVADTRATPPGVVRLAEELPQVRLVAGQPFSPALLDASEGSAAIQLVLKSPGLSPLAPEVAALTEAAADRGVLTLGELTLFSHALRDLKAARGYAPKVVAITGTNGKTTTTSLTAQLLERCGWRVGLAGNIGPTLLDTLSAALDQEPEAAVADVETPAVAATTDVSAPDQAEAAVPVDTVTESPADESVEMPVDAIDEPEVSTAAAATVEGVQPSAEATPLPVDASGEIDIERIGGGPPPHLIPPPPPGPVFVALPEAWVLELSSFQLDGVSSFEPSSAAALNITQDHLDWHGDMAAYAAAKARIYGPADTSRAVETVMVVNRDDPAVLAMIPQPQVLPEAPAREPGKRAPAKVKPPRFIAREVLSFGLDAPQAPGDFGLVEEAGMAWLVRAHPLDPIEAEARRVARLAGKPLKARKGAEEAEDLVLQRLMPADALRIRGRHNAANALAALALASAAGAPLAPMLHGLREYRGEPHRVEWLTVIDGIEAYDDSKGTNVGATVAALDGLGADKAPGKLAIILGGDGKGQDFTPLAPPLARNARAVALIGKDAGSIAVAVGAACAAAGVAIQRFDDLPAATRWCFEQARSGDAVLLSPACASLDMFRNYAHRAEVFVDTVREVAIERGEVSA